MKSTAWPRPRAGGLAMFAVVAALVLVVAQAWREPPPLPTADARRYVDYALNVYQHGVFGLSPAGAGEVLGAGAANAPLYPMFMAGVIALTPEVVPGLECVRLGGPYLDCDFDGQPFVHAHAVLVWLLLLATWVLAQRVFDSRVAAWLAGALLLASGEPLYYTDHLLTENLTLPLFAWMSVCLLVAGVERSTIAAVAGGVLGGLIALTRPEFPYLSAAIAGALLLAGVAWRERAWRRAALAWLVACLLVLSPWLARNHVHFQRIAITFGYGDYILSERVSYNRMGWDEWAAAFVYWVPGMGDSLARRLLPEHSYARLGWGPDSYYGTAAQVSREARASAPSTDQVFGWLLREKVLSDPFKHAAVTVALAWRGMFIAKGWGIIAWACAFWVLWRGPPGVRQRLLLALSPCVFMLLFYAAVSVSVHRYNLVMLPSLAACMAWVLALVTRALWGRVRGVALPGA